MELGHGLAQCLQLLRCIDAMKAAACMRVPCGQYQAIIDPILRHALKALAFHCLWSPFLGADLLNVIKIVMTSTQDS